MYSRTCTRPGRRRSEFLGQPVTASVVIVVCTSWAARTSSTSAEERRLTGSPLVSDLRHHSHMPASLGGVIGASPPPDQLATAFRRHATRHRHRSQRQRFGTTSACHVIVQFPDPMTILRLLQAWHGLSLASPNSIVDPVTCILLFPPPPPSPTLRPRPLTRTSLARIASSRSAPRSLRIDFASA